MRVETGEQAARARAPRPQGPRPMPVQPSPAARRAEERSRSRIVGGRSPMNLNDRPENHASSPSKPLSSNHRANTATQESTAPIPAEGNGRSHHSGYRAPYAETSYSE